MLDPFAQAIRSAHVARRDVFLQQWWTAGHEARWLAERAQWEAGEAMICSTVEMFRACMFAGLDREAARFTFANDRDDSRWWLVPGSEGGRVVECDVEGMPL
ncbi:hypothetical protein [Humibacter ginsengiterrae]